MPAKKEWGFAVIFSEGGNSTLIGTCVSARLDSVAATGGAGSSSSNVVLVVAFPATGGDSKNARNRSMVVRLHKGTLHRIKRVIHTPIIGRKQNDSPTASIAPM